MIAGHGVRYVDRAITVTGNAVTPGAKGFDVKLNHRAAPRAGRR